MDFTVPLRWISDKFYRWSYFIHIDSAILYSGSRPERSELARTENELAEINIILTIRGRKYIERERGRHVNFILLAKSPYYYRFGKLTILNAIEDNWGSRTNFQESLIQLDRNRGSSLFRYIRGPSRSTITSNGYLLNTLHVLMRLDRGSRGRVPIITGGINS